MILLQLKASKQIMGGNVKMKNLLIFVIPEEFAMSFLLLKHLNKMGLVERKIELHF